MEGKNDNMTLEEAIQRFDHAANATISGYAEALEQYANLTKDGVGGQLAVIESLKVQHAAEATRYKWLAAQAESVGDLKSATLFAREADQSAQLVASLSQEWGSAHRNLAAYAEAREASLLAKVGGSKSALLLLKKAGIIGNTVDLVSALSSGNDVDVTKALASIAVGSTLARTVVALTSAVNPVLGIGAAALTAWLTAKYLPKALNEEQWSQLTDLGKSALNGFAEGVGSVWRTFMQTFGGDLDDIASAANDKFLSALNLIRRIDPLVLDLDGDGIETLATDAGVLFDFDGDGIRTGTGWIKGDDGFLVFDRDGNGLIDSGKELFGVDTVKRDGTKARNGFDALADLDSNGDGLFDENDEMFSRVRVWQDLNRDGIAQANELKTLAEHRIKAIVLKSQEANEDSNGNLISATSSYIREDGSEGDVNGNHSLAADVDLESNPFYSEHTDPVEVDDEVNKLPSLRGSGLVRELREASMLSPALRELVAAYAASSSHREQQDMLDRLIAAWAATGVGYESFEQRIDGLDRNGVDFRFAFSWETAGREPTAAQAVFRDRLGRLNVLEAFNGQPFLEFSIQSMTGTSARVAVRMGSNTVVRTVAIRNGVAVLTEADLPIWNDVLNLLDASYKELAYSVQSGLLLQTRLKQYADVIDITLEGELIALDFGRVFQRLEEVVAADPVQGIFDGLDLMRSVKSFDVGRLSSLLDSWVGSLSADQRGLVEAGLAGEGRLVLDTSASSSVNAGNGNDLVFGLAGNDKLYGQDGNDLLWGQEGNDSLYGGNGSDVLIGGAGDDRLEGGAGSDTYIFGRGHGWDTIYNSDKSAGRWDVLQFLEGIAPEDVYARRGSNYQLYLYIRGTKEGLAIDDYFYTESSRLNDIRFADGTSWSFEQIKAMVLESTDGDDTRYGYASDDVISGGLGKDVLYGNGGNDRLDGGAGDDKLYGGDGDDVLTGGAGDDRLEGGAGSDTYVFGRGHGWDVIYNSDKSAGRWDVLQFLEGIAPEDVYARRGSNYQLYLYIRGTKEGLTIDDYFYTQSSRLNDIRFADGTSWSFEQIKAMVLESSDGDDTLYGYASDDIVTGGLGKDVLYGNGGNDRLDGGAGDDKLYGGDGDDVLTGSTGDDRLEGGAGSDTYIFGRGHGWDVIYNSDKSAGRWDVLQFLEGIAPEDVYARRGSNYQLYLYIRGTKEGLTIDDYFYTESSRLNDIRFADGTSWSFEQIKAMVLESSDGDDTLYGYASDDIVTGGLGKDVLYGNGGNDRLDGGAGDDKLYGGDGDDVLTGSAGDDRLEGGAGSDTYVFGRGHGWDVIYNSDKSAGRWDVLQFLEGIAPEDVYARRGSNYQLYLYIRGTKEGLAIDDYFYTESSRLNDIRFADGTSWSFEQIKAMVLESTDGDDTRYGYASDDVISGGLGKDVLYGNGGNDRLDGGAGDDKLYGGDGDDVLTGGAGDDRLEGGAGSDTYIFGRGHGWDTIYNSDKSAGRWDVLQFLEGIAPEDVYARRGSNYQLYLYIRGTKEGIAIDDYFNTESSRLNDIRFADGTSWSFEQIKAMVLESTDGDDTRYGYASDDVISGGLGKDVLYGNAGNDRLDGGAGDDKLYGGDGDDYLEGGTGLDTLEGGDGDDVLHTGTGGGWLTGGAGSDTYLFGRGDGLVTVYNNDSSQGRNDVLQFLEGVSVSEVAVERVNNDLHLYLKDRSDRIRVSDYFRGSSYRVDAIRFGDGTEWSHEYIQDRLSTTDSRFAAAAPGIDSPATWTIEQDLDALISAIAGAGSSSAGMNVMPPPAQLAPVNWASLAS